ncbi:Dps family protein [Methylocystis hirsuta]|uniref:DNA starvation/stationary phase protection protein n=1 Tax=Methylocystis hirsuta TaxID=369798 RepID=A0A3M9XJM2_9HYPH|nr:DNA starvation/stationary phase protection protein [Methylocystis hirsuta]MBI5012600.1 DNA starvation/stationary phase protection protein [Methylocystis sp.]MBI5314145.1 DNA starvation/stationary phase protection protein [Methylocystis sp.]RNJ48453.1 DNA starvation/stationary phase protection protein [Methylocystis hirsuta]
MQKTKTPMNPDTERSALNTPTDLEKQSTMKIAAEVNKLVADALALYLKTKNFHWHMSGPHFRDYHLLLDEQATQIYATVDPLAERVRKLGQPTLRSIGHIAKLSRVKDNNEEFVSPYEMLSELLEDNKSMAESMRSAHKVCDDNEDIATASLLETFLDETEKRTWFLFEAARGAGPGGH